MSLKTPLSSLKKNLHLPKFVRALYDEAFSIQIVKNPYHDFFHSDATKEACVAHSSTW